MTYHEKLNEIVKVCNGGMAIDFNNHYRQPDPLNPGKLRTITTEEYIEVLRQTHPGSIPQDREILNFIIKSNKIVELKFSVGKDDPRYTIVTYNLETAVQEAWALLELLGKVGRYA